jgi:outer membrane protein
MTHLRPIAAGISLLLASSLAASDTLRQIYELALENDAQLKSAAATFRANQEAPIQARSRLLPQIQAQGSYSESDTEQDAIQPQVTSDPNNPNIRSLVAFPSTIERDSETTAWSVSLTQTLFDLPAWFSFRQGQQLSVQAEAQFAAAQQELIVRVADAYFNVLRAQDNLRASRAEERATQRQLEQTQQRFEVGLIAITDVHEAQAAYDATVAQRLTDEGNLAIALEALSVITGRHHDDLWQLNKDFPIAAPTPTDRGAWVEFALANNFALKAAFAGMEAARYGARAARMEHLPKISGSLVHEYQEVDGTQDFRAAGFGGRFPGDSEVETQAVMLSVSMPIFTGGLVSSQRRQAAEQYNASMEDRIFTERSVIQATRAQHIAVMTDTQRVEARAQAIVSAQSALDATQAGYEVGTRNIVDVLDAQRTLFLSLRDYANARYDYVLNTLRLKQNAGILSPQDIVDLDQWLVAPAAPGGETFRDLVDDI